MLHGSLTHIRVSIFAAMLLYLRAIPVLIDYLYFLFSPPRTYRELRWVYVGAMDL
jgi:hypothetical protein